MGTDKTVLTTGDVARLCSVAPRTVSKWFDSGELRGYRIPGSKDRRIPVDELVRFLRVNGMPLNGLDTGDLRILIVDADRHFADSLGTALLAEEGYEVTATCSALEAGAAAAEFKPHAVIVDLTLSDVTPETMTRFVRSNPELDSIILIGVSPDLTETQGEALLDLGFAGFLRKPFDIGAIIRLIDRVSNPAASHATV